LTPQPNQGWSPRQLAQGLRRRNVIGALFLSVFLVFSGRLVYVQAVEGPRLKDEALQDRLRSYTIRAPRGEIVDADGEILATSEQRYNIGVNQRKVASFVHRVKNRDTGEYEVVGTGAEEAADLLAPLLGRDPAELGGQMVGDSTFVYIAKGLTPSQWREIRQLGIPGIEPESVTHRVYPNGTTAGNVLGYVKREQNGLEGLAGIELTFDHLLQGVDGRETVEIGAGGQVIPTGTYELSPATPGATIRLTLDRDVQFVAQQAVDETVEKYGAQWAGIAVMEVPTGRLVVLADSGAVDPGNVQAADAGARGARTVSAPYEPGSTGKLLTIAAAVDQGLVNPLSEFTVPDRMTFNGQTFKDHTPHETMRMTLTGILAESSNVGTVQVGNLMDDEERYRYMREFGFGSLTGIELPGESAGILREPKAWDGRTRMATMFGQGYAVTLVQNVGVVGAIANHGTWVAPRLVDQVELADGTMIVPENHPANREVISPEAAQTMLDMMEAVVQKGGTAPRAAINGYRVAGKTGTAQTPDATGALNGTVANFVGVVPADNPRFAVAVVVYKPTSGFYGGTIAAPIFKTVAEFALLHAGVKPSTGSPAVFPWVVG